VQCQRRCETFERQVYQLRSEVTRIQNQDAHVGGNAYSCLGMSAFPAVEHEASRNEAETRVVISELEGELEEANQAIERLKACEVSLVRTHAIEVARVLKEMDALRMRLEETESRTAAQVEHTANTVLRAKPRRSAMNMLSDVKKMFEHLCNKLLHEEVDAEDLLMSNARRNKALIGTTVFKQFLPEIPNATTPVWFEGVVESSYRGLYLIKYTDGDSEEMTLATLKQQIAIGNARHGNATQPAAISKNPQGKNKRKRVVESAPSHATTAKDDATTVKDAVFSRTGRRVQPSKWMEDHVC
jgi:hypothetical protein